MTGLIAVIENAGFTLSVGKGHPEETATIIYGQVIKFGLHEKVDRVDLVPAPLGSMLRSVLNYGGRPVSFEPTGLLIVEVWNSWGANQKRWQDRKTLRLEELIPRVFAGFIRVALE
jgi:hypothetical protein